MREEDILISRSYSFDLRDRVVDFIAGGFALSGGGARHFDISASTAIR